MTTTTAAAANGATPGIGLPFSIASRPQSRFSNTQTVNNLASAGSFQIVQLPATGWVRALELQFTASYTTSAAAALVAGDAPFNLASAITLTDATGQPVVQPISGYNAYLVNKYLDCGWIRRNQPYTDPRMTSSYAFSVAGGTAGTATWSVYIVFEQDANTGYGSIPNLDSNASLQLKVDYAAIAAAFTGGTASAASLSMRVGQHYWAPTAEQLGGISTSAAPPGAGDYVETRYETQTVSASAENLVSFTNRGGMVKGVLLISRASGTRTALTESNNFGVLLDNQPITEGITLGSHYDKVRAATGYTGATATTSYAPLTAGVSSGMDAGVVPLLFYKDAGHRDAWLNTRVGSLFQARLTPGASATTLEVVTQLAQVRDPAAFYARG